MSLPAGLELASPWRRLGAQLLDILWMAPMAFLLAMLGMAARGGEELSLGGEVMLDLVIALSVLVFWAARGGTPGKLALGIRILDAATLGAPPLGRLVARYLGYIVSALPFGLGYLWIFWDRQAQGWHDKLGRTLVVRVAPGGAARPSTAPMR